MSRVFLDQKVAKECKDLEAKQVVLDSLVKLEHRVYPVVMVFRERKVYKANQGLQVLKVSQDPEDCLE